jgi:hypothetical protein
VQSRIEEAAAMGTQLRILIVTLPIDQFANPGGYIGPDLLCLQ